MSRHIALVVNLVPLGLSHYAFGINSSHYSKLTVSIVDFIAANVIGTLIAMAFRYWAYRRWVFPDELTPEADALSGARSDIPQLLLKLPSLIRGG